MRFTCPACSKSYRLTREHLGSSGGAKIKCPNCKTVVRVKLGEGETLVATLANSGAIEPQAAAAAAAAQRQQPAAAAEGGARRTGDVTTSAPIWHVAVGKSAQGPMAIGQIQAMIDAGKFGLDALGWRKGMANWAELAEIPELRGQLREALSGPRADPAGVDPSGNAPTVMADVVSVPETAEDFHGASTLKPDRGVGTGAALPRAGRAAPGLSPAAASDPARAQAAGTNARTSQATAAQPARPPADARGAASAAPVPGATAPAGAGKSAARITGAQKPSPAQPAKNPARTTGGSAGAAQAGAASSAGSMFPSAGQGAGPLPAAAASTASFFESNDNLMGDIELDLPDPNKHKPTKEEYQNLLQEFSVMFRLDKRSKRQKVAIAVVLSLLLVGVISFGIILYLQGQQRQALIRDSKTILAVFSLDYQTSVTVNLTREAEEEAEKTGQKVEGGPAGLRTTSKLAEQLRVKLKEKRMAGGGGGGGGKRAPRVAVNAGSGSAPKLTAEEQATIRRLQEEAKARKLASVGGRSEAVVGVGGQASQVSRAELAGMCRAAAPDLRGCAERIAGGSAFTAVVHINTAGNVDKVDALVGGSRDGALSSCAMAKMSKKRFGLQKSETTYNCEVN